MKLKDIYERMKDDYSTEVNLTRFAHMVWEQLTGNFVEEYDLYWRKTQEAV